MVIVSVKPWKSCNANRRTLRTWSRAFKCARSPASMAACGKPSSEKHARWLNPFRVALRGFGSPLKRFAPPVSDARFHRSPRSNATVFRRSPFRMKDFPEPRQRARPPAASSFFHREKGSRARRARSGTFSRTRRRDHFFFPFQRARPRLSRRSLGPPLLPGVRRLEDLEVGRRALLLGERCSRSTSSRPAGRRRPREDGALALDAPRHLLLHALDVAVRRARSNARHASRSITRSSLASGCVSFSERSARSYTSRARRSRLAKDSSGSVSTFASSPPGASSRASSSSAPRRSSGAFSNCAYDIHTLTCFVRSSSRS